MSEHAIIQTSSVYGPVSSWRLGRSLGIDLNLIDSICSFRCIYCQLGKINVPTAERQVFVPTGKVIEDLVNKGFDGVDCVTISGSGEPTLARNLGEVVDSIKELTDLPVIVLTNATLLDDGQVRAEIARADRVFCKLDAATEESFKLVNRPVPGLTLERVLKGIAALRKEYGGFLAIQTMLLPIIRNEVDKIAGILKDLSPDEIQLNLPTRPIPHEWLLDWRGNHDRSDENATRLKLISNDEVEEIVSRLKRLTGLSVISPRRPE